MEFLLFSDFRLTFIPLLFILNLASPSQQNKQGLPAHVGSI